MRLYVSLSSIQFGLAYVSSIWKFDPVLHCTFAIKFFVHSNKDYFYSRNHTQISFTRNSNILHFQSIHQTTFLVGLLNHFESEKCPKEYIELSFSVFRFPAFTASRSTVFGRWSNPRGENSGVLPMIYIHHRDCTSFQLRNKALVELIL